MALSHDIDRLVEIAGQRIGDLYLRYVEQVLAGSPDAAGSVGALVGLTSRLLIIADLVGREEFASEAVRAGLDIETDDPESINIPENAQFASDDKIRRILGKPLEDIARAFADSVPQITRRIFAVAERSGSLARLLWARESVQILRHLAPTLSKQLTSGVSLRDFFTQAEHRLARTEFHDVARARLETIHRTNIATATNRAVFEEKTRPEIISATSFFEYLAVDDTRVRPHHWAFDGFIAPTDWDGWQAIWPPNGYQCRCAAPRSIFGPEALRRGLISKQDGRPLESRYKRTWKKAVAAGLLTAGGTLTGAKVQMIDRQGRRIRDSFPQEGFD